MALSQIQLGCPQIQLVIGVVNSGEWGGEKERRKRGLARRVDWKVVDPFIFSNKFTTLSGCAEFARDRLQWSWKSIGNARSRVV